MVGMCLGARSPDIADELSWHLPFCDYATSRKNPLCLFAKSQNLSLLSITGSQIPLFAVQIFHLALTANPVGLGTQTLPFPAQPSAPPSSTPQGGCPTAQSSSGPCSRGLWLLPSTGKLSSLLLSVLGTECHTLMIQQAPNFRIWPPETQAILCPVLQSSFICVLDYSSSFHPLFLLSCSQSMSDVTLLPSVICDTSKSCSNLAADNKWALNLKNRKTQTSSLKHEAF